MIVLLVFLLVEREDLRDRVLRVAAPGDLRVSTSALGDAVDRVTRYLRALAIVNFGHGAIVALGLWLLGLPGALLLGLLAAILRFVPYLGPWVAAGLALVVALASSDGWTVPLSVAAFLVALELVSNNVLEPWLFGSSVGLSPFAHILSTIFWAWLWGPIGLVLATPFTACLVAFGRYVPSLEPLAILLSDAQALPPAERLYQRLLARDVYEATALVAERTEALGRARRLGRGRDARAGPARTGSTGGAARLPSSSTSLARPSSCCSASCRSPSPTRRRRSAAAVLCLPARGGWDETVCAALARFLAALGVPARAIGHKLSAELAAEVARAGAECVCISSLASPSGAAQHLVMRIRKRCPETKVVVGLWGQTGRCAVRGTEPTRRTYLVSPLSEARDRVRGATPTLSGRASVRAQAASSSASTNASTR